MYRIIIAAIAMVASMGVVRAQSLSIEGGDVFEDGQICLDVTVSGFTDLVGMEFDLRWDSTVLEFSSLTTFTSLPGFTEGNISDPTETTASAPSNELYVTWFDNDIMPRTLPNDDVLFEVCFDAIGSVGSSSTMNLLNLLFTDQNLQAVSFDDNDNIVSITNEAGDNLTFSFPTSNADSGVIVCMPLTVLNFDSITDFSFGVKWDATVLSYMNINNSGLLQNFTNGNISIIGSDSMFVNWFDLDNSGESLVTGSQLFEVCYRLVGAPARSSLLQFGGLSANKVDGPVTDLSTNNGLVIINSPPLAEDLRLASSNITVNPTQSFCMPVRVNGFSDLTGLDFKITWDNNVVEYVETRDFVGLAGLDINDISVTGSDPSFLDFSWNTSNPNGENLNFNTKLFEVCFNAVGNAGTQSPFNFSLGNATNADGLPVAELYTNVTIDVTQPSAPDVEFRLDTITLMDGESGCLTMTVDEFNAIRNLSFDINWNTSNLTFQSASVLAALPGFDNTDLITPLTGGADGLLTAAWTDDNAIGRSLTVGSDFLEICFQAAGSDQIRDFNFLNLNVENSLGTNVDAVGSKGRIIIPSDGSQQDVILRANDITLNQGEDDCFEVTVDNFEDLIVLEFEVQWDESIFDFIEVRSLANLEYFTSSAISHPADGELVVSWFDNDLTGRSLPNGTVLFEVCGQGVMTGMTVTNLFGGTASLPNSVTVPVTEEDGSITVNGSGTNTVNVIADDYTVNQGDNICVPIEVTGFTDLITAEFNLRWDVSILEFTSLQNLATMEDYSSSSLSTPPANMTNNEIILSWSHSPLTGQSLTNNTAIYEACFNAIGVGRSDLELYNDVFADISTNAVTSATMDGSVRVNGTSTSPTIIAGDDDVQPNDNFCIPLSVRNFDQIAGFEFVLAWDAQVLQFDRLENFNVSLAGWSGGSVSVPPGNGSDNEIVASWLENDLNGVDLPDDAVIMDVCFDAIGSLGDQSTLEFSDLLFANNQGMALPNDQQNGLVRIQAQNNANFSLTTTTGNAVDQGQQRCLPITVSGFEDITELEFELTWDDTKFTYGSIQNIASVSGLNIANFTTPPMGPNSKISFDYTNATGASVADGTTIFDLCLTGSGQEGDFSTVEFSGLTVENLDGATINTTLNNGDIRINQDNAPGNVKLIGEETSGDANTQVCATISVEEFSNLGALNFIVEWDDAVLDFVSVNTLGTLAGFDGNSVLDPIEQPSIGATVVVDWDHPTGSSATLPTPSDLLEICFDLIGLPGSTSGLNFTNILAEDASGAAVPSSFQDGMVRINSTNTSDFTLLTEEVTGNTGEEVCVDVTVRNFSDILSVEFLLEWNPNIATFSEVRDLVNLPNFTSSVIATSNPGLLVLAWFDESLMTHTLPDDAKLFTVCYDIIGTPGSITPLHFEDIQVSKDGVNLITAFGDDGLIRVERSIEDLIFDISDETTDPGEEVCVQFDVTNFFEMDELNLEIDWDENILEYTETRIISAVPGLNPLDFVLNGDKLEMSWVNQTGVGITLADGSNMFDVCFNAIGAAGSSSPVEITDGSGLNSQNIALNIGSNVGTVSLNDVLSINNVEVDSVSCFGLNDGRIELGVTGGAPMYTYTWDPALSTGPVLAPAAAGNYDVTVEDQNGTRVTRTITVFQPDELTIDPVISAVTPPLSNGVIDLNIDGGTEPYSIDWCCSLTNDLEIQRDLSQGVYSATIIDANGCEIETGDINLSGGLMVAVTDETDPRCSDSEDGSITVDASGGTPPYQIVWRDDTGTAVGVDFTLSNVSSGTYDYTITDSSNPTRTETGSATLDGPPPIVINLDISPETNTGNDGSIINNSNGGTGTLTFNWFKYETSTTSTNRNQINLTTGYYRLDVFDSRGCRVFQDSVFVGPPISVPSECIVIDSISCPGACDGKITIKPLGGTGSYEYSYNGGTSSGSNMKDGLCAGQVVVIVRDLNNSDVVVVRVNLNDPPPMVLTANTIGVTNGGDGGIILDVSGGNSPYDYNWEDTNDNVRNRSGLNQGTYNVTVTDANGCEAVLENILVDIRKLEITILNIQQVICEGSGEGAIDVRVTGGCPPYSYFWRRNGVLFSTQNNVNNLEPATYQLQVIDTCNETLFTSEVQITSQSDLATSAAVTTNYNGFGVSGFGMSDGSARVDVTGGVNPITIVWSNGSNSNFVSGLMASVYTVTVTDGLGCESIEQVTISSPDELIIGVEILAINSCANENDGVARVRADGGVEPYQFNWENNSSTTEIANNLGSGLGSVTVTDANGVEVSQTFFIGTTATFDIDTLITPDDGNATGSIGLVVTGGDGPYDYQWNDINNSTTSSINRLLAGDYQVVVTDANGCAVLLTITVPLRGSGPECLDSRLVFSPNDDGKNDLFVIQCIESIPNTLQIFNRWGDLVFEAEGYANTWGGDDMLGQPLPQGAYFYVLDYVNQNGLKEIKKGHISLLR